MKTALLYLIITLFSSTIMAQTSTNLAGILLGEYPGFQYPRSFNWDEGVWASLDPDRFDIDGTTADVYVVESRSAEEWDAENNLEDIRLSGFQTNDFFGTNASEIALLLAETEDLPNFLEARPGVGYDIVFDMDQDGMLGEGDFIDGYSDEPGFFMVGNMFNSGPYEVDTTEYSTSFWHTSRIYYPSNIQDLVAQPLVVISHGWTHEYWYYDYLGQHLASHGYVVMSHRNEVGNGGPVATETASTTALQNIDTLLSHVWDIQGGILGGKIDKNRIIHAGHSTGGECVVRAYTRLASGDYISPHITHENIVLVCSLAPVAFLTPEVTNPLGANYHQFLAAADTDVSGAPVNSYQQAFSIYERGYGNKQITYIHGAGHGDLHDEDVFAWVAGPDLIGKEATHTVVKPYFLALCDLYSRNNLAMKDYFTRNRFAFRPSNIDDEIVVSGEYKDADGSDNLIIDDFQSNEETDLASSGATVESSMQDLHEILMQDMDGSFNWDGTQWSNGMTRSRYSDNPRCAVMTWEPAKGEMELNYLLTEDQADWSDFGFLSFRACQMTRHPLNEALEGIHFTVTLADGNGNESSINFEEQGIVHPPYPKSNGGIMSICLEEGIYTIEIGGSQWEEEQFFEIPGYFDEMTGAGSYILEIGEGDPCTEIEVLMYDTFGDGWDNGVLSILDAFGNSLIEGTLLNGFEPDLIPGWQNEFNIIRLRLADFLTGDTQLDFSNMATLTFSFGDGYGSNEGAIGLDDIELVRDELNFVVSDNHLPTPTLSALVYPNPAITQAYLRLQKAYDNWSYEIYNQQGKLVASKRINQGSFSVIERNGLASGIYLVLVRTEDGIGSCKLVFE